MTQHPYNPPITQPTATQRKMTFRRQTHLCLDNLDTKGVTELVYESQSSYEGLVT